MLEGLPITIVDLVVVGAILLFAVLASFWGFMGLVTGIGAWVGAVAAAILFYPDARMLARSHIETELFADVVAGLGLFAGSLILLLVVSAVLSHMVKESALGSINRALGFVTGIVLGYVIACVFLIAGNFAYPGDTLPQSVTNARLYPLVRAGSYELLAIMPDELKTESLRTMERTRQQIDDAKRAKDLYDTLNNPKPRGDEPARESGANGGATQGNSEEQGYAPEANRELESLIDEADR